MSRISPSGPSGVDLDTELRARALDAGVRFTALDSGVTVVTEEMPGARSVSTGVWVNVGSRDEDPGLAGCSHFLEHVLFKGTPRRSALDIAQAIDAIGGEMNAYTTKEYTTFYTRTIADDAALCLDILTDILSDPAMAADDVESERQVILEEIALRADEPADLVHDLTHIQRFGDHGLGRDTAGYVETVSTISSAHLRSYMDERYCPTSIVVSAAGAVDHEATVKTIEQSLRRPAAVAVPRQRPSTTGDRLVVRSDETEQAHVVLALGGMERNDPDRFAFALLDHVLGGGMSSRLFHEIREKRGLVYSVYSYRSLYEDGGFMGIYAGTSPEHVVEVLDLIDTELMKLRRDGIGDDELRRAKSSIRGATALSLEDSGSRMTRLGRSQLLYGWVPSVDWVLSETDAVSREDIARVVEMMLSARRTLAVVGPVDRSVLDAHPVLG